MASNFQEAYENLISNSASEDDVIKISSVLKRRLSTLTPDQISQLGFKKNEFECLLFLLNYAARVPNLQAQYFSFVDSYSKARKMLLTKPKKGIDRSDKRIKQALECFGISIQGIRDHKKEYLKFCYEYLYEAEPESKENGVNTLIFHHDNGKTSITWSNNTQKKRAIVEALEVAFPDQSHDAIIQELKRTKTKNIPAFKNSGMRNMK